MDRKLVKDFVDAVKKQTRLYVEIKGLMENKASAIAGGDTGKIGAATEKEEKLTDAIRLIEQDKKNIFDKMAGAAGFKESSEAFIGDVLLKLEKESAAETEQALTLLFKAASEVAGQNQQNAYLLKNRLEFAGFSEAARQKIEQPENTVYGRSGGKKSEKSKNSPKIDRTI